MFNLQCQELSDLVATLRDENDALKHQLDQAGNIASINEQEASRSLEKLSSAAQQWRQEYEEVIFCRKFRHGNMYRFCL